MLRSVVLAMVTTGAALGVTSAHAGGVSWSIGINAPAVGAVVSSGPGYYGHGYGAVYAPAPVYAQPVYAEPVYVAPAPVYRVPPRVYYPAPVYYRPAPVVYPRYYHDRPEWRHGHRHRDGYYGPR
jgi:hypothetical protein